MNRCSSSVKVAAQSQSATTWSPQRGARRLANGRTDAISRNGKRTITVNGDKASVIVIKDGLRTPTAVEPAGDVIWVAERGAGKAVSIPMPK